MWLLAYCSVESKIVYAIDCDRFGFPSASYRLTLPGTDGMDPSRCSASIANDPSGATLTFPVPLNHFSSGVKRCLARNGTKKRIEDFKCCYRSGCLPHELTGTELAKRKTTATRCPTPTLVGVVQTGQLQTKKQPRRVALLRPWSVWATIYLQPLPNRPHIIRSNRPNIKAIHPKPQSPVSHGHLIHIR